jgi:hypothetical protein
MSKAAFNRDGILTPEERMVAARKCVANLRGPLADGQMSSQHAHDFEDIAARIEKHGCSERQLAYLRDLNEKY